MSSQPGETSKYASMLRRNSTPISNWIIAGVVALVGYLMVDKVNSIQDTIEHLSMDFRRFAAEMRHVQDDVIRHQVIIDQQHPVQESRR